MTDALPAADIVLKWLIGIAVLIFSAGKTWSTVAGMVGSLAALHRRFTEFETASKARDTVVDAQFVALRLDIARLQTWKQTLRFRMPEGEAHKDTE